MKMLDRTNGALRLISVHRIAHATDLTAASENALAWATYLAKANEAELLLLHVVPPPTPIFEVESPTQSKAEFELSVLLTKLKSGGVNARGFVLSDTKPVDRQIIQAARLEKSDLIVMGTSGRTGLSRLFVGSIAARVIARSPCPVLVIRNGNRAERGSDASVPRVIPSKM